MKIYGEVSCLLEAGILWIAMMAVSVWFDYPLRFRWFIGLMLFHIGICVLIFACDLRHVTLVMIPVLFFSYRRWKWAICVWVFRWMISLSFCLAMHGSFYYGICTVPISCNWWIFGLLMIVLCHFALQHLYMNHRWRMESMMICIRQGDIKTWVSAYWDTGNRLSYASCPVILVHGFEPTCISEHHMWIQNKWRTLYAAEVSGWHIPSQKVYIAAVNHLFFGQYEALLNAEMERIG